MKLRAVIGVLRIFLQQLLHAVLAAYRQPRRYRLAHALRVVHLRRADEVYLSGAASCTACGRGYIFLCQRDVLSYRHFLYPSNA